MTYVRFLLLNSKLETIAIASTQSRLKCYGENIFTNHIYLLYMYKQDLTWNKPNQTKH